jgi:hypothetical protein
VNKRDLIVGALSVVSSMAVATSTDDAARAADQEAGPVDVTPTVNGQFFTISVEARTTLLDALLVLKRWPSLKFSFLTRHAGARSRESETCEITALFRRH